MKYTTEKAIKEIKRRARTIRQKHDRRVTNILASTACISLTALFAVIGGFSGSEISKAQTEYGAFIISVESGGYILASVLGFVLGVIVTIGIKKLNRTKQHFITNKFVKSRI